MPELTLDIRILTPSDYSQIMSLYSSRDEIMGIARPGEHEEDFGALMEDKYLAINDVTRLAWGAFLDGNLVSMMGMAFWSYVPHWTLSHLHVRRSEVRQRFDPLKSGVWQMLTQALGEAEKRGHYKYFVVSSVRHHNGFAKAGMGLDFLANRYMVVIEDLVPENCRPRFDYVWDMMGRKTWSCPLIVRSGTLRNEFRTELIDRVGVKRSILYRQDFEA